MSPEPRIRAALEAAFEPTNLEIVNESNLHAGHNPGHPASHGCIRLPSAFAKKLYSVTQLGTPVYIGA